MLYSIVVNDHFLETIENCFKIYLCPWTLKLKFHNFSKVHIVFISICPYFPHAFTQMVKSIFVTLSSKIDPFDETLEKLMCNIFW